MENAGGLILILIIGLFKGASLAFNIVFDTLYPAMSARIQSAYVERPRRCVLLGAVNLVAWVLVAILLFQTQVLALFGLVITAFIVGGAVLAYAPAYRGVAERLPGHEERGPIRGFVLGWLLIESAFLVPFIGWLASAAVLIRGFGAVVTALLASRRNEAHSESPSVSTTEADAST
jgi:MFS family permease